MILYVLLKWDDYSNRFSENSPKAAVPTQGGVWVRGCSSAPAQAHAGQREPDGCTSRVQPSTEPALASGLSRVRAAPACHRAAVGLRVHLSPALVCLQAGLEQRVAPQGSLR